MKQLIHIEISTKKISQWLLAWKVPIVIKLIEKLLI